MKSCCPTGTSSVHGKAVIALIGQPNCGKTTLFNRLTGTHQTTGNWPGVTVERKEGLLKLGDLEAKIIDLPGVYSLLPDTHSGMDEAVARNFLTCQPVDLVINVVDATALERQLFLTMQLLHMGLPVVVVLNRTDLLKKHQLDIDVAALSKALGCPVVPTSAYKNQGIDTLKQLIPERLNCRCQLQLTLPQPFDKALAALQPYLETPSSTCWPVLQWLLAPEAAPDTVRQTVQH